METVDIIKTQQEVARGVNGNYKQMAGDVLMGGIPDVVLDHLVSTIIANIGRELEARCEELPVRTSDTHHGDYINKDDTITLIRSITGISPTR